MTSHREELVAEAMEANAHNDLFVKRLGVVLEAVPTESVGT